MGMRMDDLMNLTPIILKHSIEAFSKHREDEYRNMFEAARLTGYMAVIPYMDKKRNVGITDIIEFPWEKSKRKLGKILSVKKKDGNG